MNKKKYYVSDGTQSWEFSSVRSIFHYTSPIYPITYQDIGHNFNDSYFDFDKLEKVKVSYIVYDYLHRVIRKEDLEHIYADEPSFRVRRSYRANPRLLNYLGFRNGPVPLTGKRTRGFYNWYRAIKTTQERRWNYAHKKYTRGKRRHLKDAWDEVPRGERLIKYSWKKQKKRKQWM